MEKAEIGDIADYLVDLEEGLVELDYGHIGLEVQLSKLYPIIEALMNETFKTKDQKLKTFLALLEYKARKCKQCIERRLKVSLALKATAKMVLGRGVENASWNLPNSVTGEAEAMSKNNADLRTSIGSWMVSSKSDAESVSGGNLRASSTKGVNPKMV